MLKFVLKLLPILAIVGSFMPIPAFAQYGGGGAVYQSWTSFGNITTNPTISVTSSAIQLPASGVSGTTGAPGLVAKICNLGTVGADMWLSFGTANTITASAGAGSWLPFGTCGAFNLQPFVATHYTWLAAICVGPACSAPLYIETGVGTPNLH